MASPSGPVLKLLADEQLQVLAAASKSASVSVGGLVNLTNDGSTGAGLVLYSNRGADAAGRLLVVNQANAANPQQAARIQNAGTGHAVSISYTGTGGEALDVVGTDRTTTAVGIQGAESGRGTVKITHEHPAAALANDDANASVLRLNWQDTAATGTAVQGIVAQSEPGGPTTTGDLLRFYPGPVAGVNPKLRLRASGVLVLDEGVVIGGYAAASVLTLRGSDVGAGGAINIYDQLVMHTSGADPGAGVYPLQEWSAAVATAAATTWRYVSASPTLTLSANPGNPLMSLFSATPTFINSGTPRALGPVNILTVSPTWAPGVADTITNASLRAVNVTPTWNAFTTGAGTSNFAYGLIFTPNVNTGWTMTILSALKVSVLAGAGGTVTDWHGVDIDAEPGTRVTGVLASLRSRGAAPVLRHLGPGVFGADAAPTVGSVALEVQSTTRAFLLSRMTVAQRNALTAVDGMVTYDSDAPPGFDGRINGAWRRLLDVASGVTEVEIDVGATPVLEATVNKVDANVTTTSKIIFKLSGKAPTGKDTDDVFVENIVLAAEPKAGSIDWRIRAIGAPNVGDYPGTVGAGWDDWIAGAYLVEYVVA